jgi:hypothetical protein
VLKNLLIPTKENNYNPFFSTKVVMVILTLWVLLFNSFATILFSHYDVHAVSLSADRIIELTNEERIKSGLGPVKADALLTSAAYAKANNMLNEQYWDHFGPNGESPWQFIKASGYSYIYAGENLGKGFTTSEGLHQAWMASPTHKENIIGKNYKDIGIAIVNGNLNGEDVFLVVQMFGALHSGVTEVPKIQKESETVKQPTPVRIEQGEAENGNIKSIRIVYPEEGMTYTEPKVPVKGEAINFGADRMVQIVTGNQILGEAQIEKDNSWEFKNAYDWREGPNSIDAVITDGIEKYRDSVNFVISSVPPKVLGVNVNKEEEEFRIVVEVEDTAVEVSLVTGDQIIKGEIIANLAEFSISEDDIQGKVYLVISDVHGNFDQEDITSYFVEKESKSSTSLGGFINFNLSSIQRTIMVVLAILALTLLLIQMYFYKQYGKLKEKSGDFLMVGVWWLIFLFGSFIGYSGSIY